jgi:tetratricopeptide (TPR) repeat protein
MQRGAFAEAEEALGRALAIDPRSAATHKAMGVLLAESLGRRAEGVEHIRQALALDPRINDGERMRQMVDAYDKEQARAR